MVIEGIRPNIEREPHLRPALDQPEVIDALRHGNIYEILRMPGINRRDIEDYIASQHRVFQNQIVQDYEIFSHEAHIPPPDLDRNFPVHMRDMIFDSEDRGQFRQEMLAIQQNYQPEVHVADGKPKVRFSEMKIRSLEGPEGPGQAVKRIAEKAVNDAQDFFNTLSNQVIDQQMVQEMRSKSADLNREIQRIISLVLSGQVDPEYVLIAAAKSNMMQNGTLFSWKGKKIMHLNDEMNNITKNLVSMDANDSGYLKETQLASSKTRAGQTQMSLEMMDIQKFAQNIATTLDWVGNAIRMMAQMRQTPTQAIAAR